MQPGRSRCGVTLIELLVAITLMGLMAAVVGLGPPGAPRSPVDATVATLGQVRRDAINAGRSVTVTIAVDGGQHVATALPDGSIVADSGLAVDRLSGSAETAAQAAGTSHAP